MHALSGAVHIFERPAAQHGWLSPPQPPQLPALHVPPSVAHSMPGAAHWPSTQHAPSRQESPGGQQGSPGAPQLVHVLPTGGFPFAHAPMQCCPSHDAPLWQRKDSQQPWPGAPHVVSQRAPTHTPEVHAPPEQHGWPAPPQLEAKHVPMKHTPVVHSPAQHGWSSAPQGWQTPSWQLPAEHVASAQHGWLNAPHVRGVVKHDEVSSAAAMTATAGSQSRRMGQLAALAVPGGTLRIRPR